MSKWKLPNDSADIRSCYYSCSRTILELKRYISATLWLDIGLLKKTIIIFRSPNIENSSDLEDVLLADIQNIFKGRKVEHADITKFYKDVQQILNFE